MAITCTVPRLTHMTPPPMSASRRCSHRWTSSALPRCYPGLVQPSLDLLVVPRPRAADILSPVDGGSRDGAGWGGAAAVEAAVGGHA
jgi:hypothetical protein